MPMGTRRNHSFLSPLYQMVQGQTHLELTQCNRIHSKCKNNWAGDSCWYLYYIFRTQECLIQSYAELPPMVPSMCTLPLEQLYSSLMLLNVQVLSLDWTPLMATLGPNDRSWSCLLKLKGLVFTLVAKLCLLYSFPYFIQSILRNLGF